MIVVLDRPTPDLRRHGGGSGVLPDHELRPAPLRHPHHPRRARRRHHARQPRRPRHRTRPRTSRDLSRHAHCGRVAGVSEACNAVGSTMPRVPMNLLFDDIEVIESVGDPSAVEVSGISHDSRRVVPGDLFCCVPGLVSDGHAHAAEAVDRGAVGLLCEHFIPELIDHDVVQTRIAPGTMRPVMARLAAAFYGYPARDLLMIGVTGTNGKTTVTQLLGDLLSATGRPTNVMGTLSGTRTTPEATEVQRVLAGVRDRQKSDGHRHAVAMEVSSHALVQSRVEGIHFDVAVFTNLSHDHLDYHGTMEEYFEAKAMLFTPSHALRGVVDADDPWGQTSPRARPDPDHRRASRRRHRRCAARRPLRVHLARAADRHPTDGRRQRRQRPPGGGGRTGPRRVGARARGDRTGDGPPRPGAGPAPGHCRSEPRSPDGTVDGAPRSPCWSTTRTHRPDWRSCSERRARLAPARPGALRLRLRGEPGPGQAAPDGRGGDATSAIWPFLTSDNPRFEDPLAIIEEVLGGVPVGGATRRSWSSPTAASPSAWPSMRRVRATSSSSPGRATRRTKRWPAERLPFDDAVEARRISRRASARTRGRGLPVPGRGVVRRRSLVARGESTSVHPPEA